MKTYLILAMLPILGGTTMARTFTDVDGRKVEADLVNVEGDEVVIKRIQDGQLFRLPMWKLSAEDQVYVRQNVAGTAASPPKPAGDPNSQPDETGAATAENKLPKVWVQSKPPASWLLTETAWLHLQIPKERGPLSAEVLAMYGNKAATEAAADSFKEGLKSAIKDFLNDGIPDPLTTTASFAWSGDDRSIEFGLPVARKSSKTWPADAGPVTVETAQGMISITSRAPDQQSGFRNESGIVNFDLILAGQTQPDGTIRGKAKGRIFFEHESRAPDRKSSGNLVFEDIDFVLSRMR